MMFGWVWERERARERMGRKGRKQMRWMMHLGKFLWLCNAAETSTCKYMQIMDKSSRSSCNWELELEKKGFVAACSPFLPTQRHILDSHWSASILKCTLAALYVVCMYTRNMHCVSEFAEMSFIQCINEGNREREREERERNRLDECTLCVCTNVHCTRYNKWLCGFNIRALITHFLKRLNLYTHI